MSKLSYVEERRRNEMFQQGQLWCRECNHFKPVKEFYPMRSPRSSVSNFGYRHYCKRCENTVKRDKLRTKNHYKQRNSQLKKKFVELAGGKCQRCGYDTFSAGLDFHHVYRADKEDNPTAVIYNGNPEKAWRELDKCCLLCRNCHAAYEASEWQAEFVKRDGLGWTVGDSLPLDDDRYQTESVPEYEQAQLPDLFRDRAEVTQFELWAA